MYCSKGESFLIDKLILKHCCVHSERFNKQSLLEHVCWDCLNVYLMAEELQNSRVSSWTNKFSHLFLQLLCFLYRICVMI
jgi:hypothetical protein